MQILLPHTAGRGALAFEAFREVPPPSFRSAVVSGASVYFLQLPPSPPLGGRPCDSRCLGPAGSITTIPALPTPMSRPKPKGKLNAAANSTRDPERMLCAFSSV